jgi:hypothetical protein
MNTKSQIDFACLLQLHMLDKTEEDKDMSWECFKVADYCKEKGDVNNSSHKCLVEWNDINKTKSWVNYFALSLSNAKTIISFTRNNSLLDKMPFVTSLSTVGQTRQEILQGYLRFQQVLQVSNTSLAYKSPKESRMKLI